jgi:threonine/homoserine/homoserine lactone efflux protein
MPEADTLVLFGAAVLGLLLSPGPNMAFLFAHSLAQGPRAGVAVATGIFLADLSLTALTALGIAALVLALPAAFDFLRVGGAAYLLRLAWQASRARDAGRATAPIERETRHLVGRAWLNSLLNPKALVLFLVFLPQFVDPRIGHVSVQLAVLGAVLSVEALVFHALLGLASGGLARRLHGPRAHFALGRLQAVIYVALAARLLVTAPLTPEVR